jgi:septal ring factor EnvC (AmiA/AmiB activator)
MALVDTLKSNALLIMGILLLVTVATATYEHFFSDNAKLIGILKDQIKEQEGRIAQLHTTYDSLNQEEAKRLEEIAQIKRRLSEAVNKIKNQGVKINDIKNEIISIDSALAIIEAHTRGDVTRGRDLMQSPAPGPGK